MLYQKKHCKNESFWNHFLMSSTPAFSMSYIPKRTSHGSGGGMGRVFRQLMTFQSLPIKKIGIFPPKNCYDKNGSKAPKMKKKRNKGKKKTCSSQATPLYTNCLAADASTPLKSPKGPSFRTMCGPILNPTTLKYTYACMMLLWCFMMFNGLFFGSCMFQVIKWLPFPFSPLHRIRIGGDLPSHCSIVSLVPSAWSCMRTSRHDTRAIGPRATHNRNK